MIARSRVLLVLLVLLSVACPTAAAFTGSPGEVTIAYAPGETPFLVASGNLSFEGRVNGGFVATGLTELTLGPVDRLTVAEGRADGNFTNATYENVRVVLDSGSVYWEVQDGTLDGAIGFPFGVFVTLPGHDDGEDRDERDEPEEEGFGSDPAALIAGEGATAALASRDGPARVFPLNATVTILDAAGRPVGGFDARHVNEGFTVGDADAPPEGGVVMEADGAFPVTWEASALALAPGDDLTLTVRPSGGDGFLTALGALETFARSMGAGAEGEDDAADAEVAEESRDDSAFLFDFVPISGVLDGAVLLLRFGANAEEAVDPVAFVGDTPLNAGLFTLLRGEEVTVAWTADGVRVKAAAVLVMTSDGFATARAPFTVGPVPLLAVLLWLGAVAALTAFIVRRPPKEPVEPRLRVAAGVTHALALVLALVLWDRAFARAFGTSVGNILRDGGPRGFIDAFPFSAGVLALEFLPWVVAVLLIALPVRILVGTGLRYKPGVKGLKGFAKAAGLLGLIVLGPAYALWVLNIPFDVLARFLPGMLP